MPMLTGRIRGPRPRVEIQAEPRTPRNFSACRPTISACRHKVSSMQPMSQQLSIFSRYSSGPERDIYHHPVRYVRVLVKVVVGQPSMVSLPSCRHLLLLKLSSPTLSGTLQPTAAPFRRSPWGLRYMIINGPRLSSVR